MLRIPLSFRFSGRRSLLVGLALVPALVGCASPPDPSAFVSSSPVSVPTGSSSHAPGSPRPGPGESTVPGVLVPIGTMASIRASHSATVLPDGRMLLAGGCVEHSCEGITADTELFDPASATSAPGPVMTEARVGHGSVVLPDGRLFLIGGFGPDSVTATTEFLDPSAGTFSAGPPMSEPRADPTALLLDDGTVLVAGGYDGRRPTAGAEIFDPATNTFRPTGSLGTARASHVSVLLHDGTVLVAGGNAGADGGSGSAVQATAELYDPKSGSWTATGDMTARRHKHAGVTLRDGRVLVVGGSDERDGRGVYRSAEIFDPKSGTFRATAEMALGRYKIEDAVVRLADGRVLVAGGAGRAELFDPATATFSTVPGGADAGWSFAVAVVLPDGSVVVSGGYDATITLTDQVARYVPETAAAVSRLAYETPSTGSRKNTAN